jgi:prolyl-tRNA synthetase
MRAGDDACDAMSNQAYEALKAADLDPLYDDTDKRAGEKFAVMDLIGLPWQVTVGPRGAAEGKVELKYRKTGEKVEVPVAEAIAKIIENHKAKVTS